MIDLLLVDPPVSNSIRFGKLAKVGSVLPSLGLAYLASVARENKFSVKIIDANLLNLNLPKLADLILSHDPKWVGISATTLTIDTVGKLAVIIKKRKPEVAIIVGGAHMTAVPKETMTRYSTIDIGVMGEGEDTLKDLLKNLKNKKEIDEIEGIVFRKNKKIIINESRKYINNLDELPLPAWDLISDFPEKYKPSANSFLKLPAVHLVTSRGCTGQCIFCDRSTFGRSPRMFSSKKVIEMIDLLDRKYGICEIQFFDDNFALFPQRLKEICKYLLKRKKKISWSCQVRADMINIDLLKLMKKAGCWQIGLGVESGSDEILKILKKQETSSLLLKVIEDIHKEGIEVKGFFILGNPGETVETLKETKEFIFKSKLDYAHTTFFTPYPGCEAYKNIEKFGTFKEKGNWSKLGHGTIKPVFIPNGLSERDLEVCAEDISKGFYFQPKIVYHQLLTVIKNPKRFAGLLNGFVSIASLSKK